MESLYFLIPIAFVLLIIAIRLLSWALKSGQYDDLDTEAHRILFDDNPHPIYRGSAPAVTPTPDQKNLAQADLTLSNSKPSSTESHAEALNADQKSKQ